ncbi:PepSY domain-containing protein [Novosphingobium sp. SG720]|uniref:PepSY domain-containing protein n=1 Tax=Novosphingobium sp. SG720 TaxID=2586998 RepID=UPI001448261F|nr:PepSY domain-containing protein [Novosphingobium sp. SG720]
MIRQIAWFHRWLGLATCVIFALWFASGAILLFQPFPALSRSGQLALARPVDVAALRVAPAAALHRFPEATALQLVQRGDVPTYLVSSGQQPIVIDGISGRTLPPLSLSAAQAEAARTLGANARVHGPFAYDQWVVHNRFDPLRPFYRLDLRDDEGTQYYLSAVTGQLVQRTTARERTWNWVGAVLHWAYFTPIRAHFPLWDNGVWWLSLTCLLVALAGSVLGVVQMLAARRLPRPALTFYQRKWMRWHHLLGLFTGLFVLTWMLSGWLSMDHGRLFSRGQATAGQTTAYAGAPLASGLAGMPLAALRQAGEFREKAFGMVGGQLITTTWDGRGAATSSPGLSAAIVTGVRAAWPQGGSPQLHALAPDAFYAQAEGAPDNALIATDPAAQRPDLIIDGRDGHLLTVLNASRKRYAWSYYALHTWRFPGLVGVPWLRQGVVLLLMLVGVAFSVTGIAVAWRRLRQSL